MARLLHSLASACTAAVALTWQASAAETVTAPCQDGTPCQHVFQPFVNLERVADAQARIAIRRSVVALEAALGGPIPRLQQVVKNLPLYTWAQQQRTVLEYRNGTTVQSRGQPADPKAFPYNWALDPTDTQQACGATAISTRRLLTAAHCVNMQRRYGAFVNGSVVSLACRRHPDYGAGCIDTSSFKANPACRPDVAICEANSDLAQSFAEPTAKLFDTTPLTSISGLGCSSEWGNVLSRIELKRGIKGDLYKPGFLAAPKMDAYRFCQGDSGSGAFLGAKVVAVISGAEGTSAADPSMGAFVLLGDPAIWSFVTAP